MIGGREEHVKNAARLVPGERTRHYWDDPGATVRGYRETLALSEPAWDIYMNYGPEVRWEGELPPAPEYWEHQLGSASRPRVQGPYLDPERFAARTATLLEER